jgi:hypothetical protein
MQIQLQRWYEVAHVVTSSITDSVGIVYVVTATRLTRTDLQPEISFTALFKAIQVSLQARSLIQLGLTHLDNNAKCVLNLSDKSRALFEF